MGRLVPKDVTVGVTEFKAKCTKLLADVEKRRVRLTVTRRGRPIARVVSAETKPPSMYGFMKGTVTILGDITEPTGEVWNVELD